MQPEYGIEAAKQHVTKEYGTGSSLLKGPACQEHRYRNNISAVYLRNNQHMEYGTDEETENTE
ncbi:hypothetical protein KTH_25330 [Thermosporothrix hazakensis]|uniref:Uncharacterized protein n=1 Tax=Thermosporothrix sp. COM3 TaxID=2490863 RepID=A0A455SPB9_9CHLR|nr:hypothetical protein KTC_42310 [Thermosporothrix sp. COM3]GCE47664.1 hypothetical protein KTH_25330 [Thermosporothrix hazakensis]